VKDKKMIPIPPLEGMTDEELTILADSLWRQAMEAQKTESPKPSEK
jgi:hypothetical protein